MKDMRKTMYCLDLETKHKYDVILIHWKAYVEKVLKCFSFDNAYPLSTFMVVRFLDPEKNPVRTKKDDEIILDLECHI